MVIFSIKLNTFFSFLYSIEGLQTLLDLGASPNYKDLKGLSPLYYCVTNSSEVVICELLLHDRSLVGATDLQGKERLFIVRVDKHFVQIFSRICHIFVKERSF